MFFLIHQAPMVTPFKIRSLFYACILGLKWRFVNIFIWLIIWLQKILGHSRFKADARLYFYQKAFDHTAINAHRDHSFMALFWAVNK